MLARIIVLKCFQLYTDTPYLTSMEVLKKFQVIRGARGEAWNSIRQLFFQGLDFLLHILEGSKHQRFFENSSVDTP